MQRPQNLCWHSGTTWASLIVSKQMAHSKEVLSTILSSLRRADLNLTLTSSGIIKLLPDGFALLMKTISNLIWNEMCVFGEWCVKLETRLCCSQTSVTNNNFWLLCAHPFQWYLVKTFYRPRTGTYPVEWPKKWFPRNLYPSSQNWLGFPPFLFSTCFRMLWYSINAN